jgi:hypothetical protein
MNNLPLDNIGEWKKQVYKQLCNQVDRRGFLRAAARGATGAALLGTLGPFFGGGTAAAAEDDGGVKTGTFFFPRLRFDDIKGGPAEWNVYPQADGILRASLAKMTNINVSQEPVVVNLADFEMLRKYPFVFATEQKVFSFPAAQEENLRKFLLRGGFVFGDDCVLGHEGDVFFQEFKKMMNRIYPDNHMQRVPDKHDIYNCFFEFPNGLPNVQGKNQGLWATFDKDSDRILTVVSPVDLHCAWTCNAAWFPMAVSQQAIKMGINIIMFYLTH